MYNPIQQQQGLVHIYGCEVIVENGALNKGGLYNQLPQLVFFLGVYQFDINLLPRVIYCLAEYAVVQQPDELLLEWIPSLFQELCVLPNVGPNPNTLVKPQNLVELL